jgi:phosphate transport system substrate-binding protein
VAAVLAPRPEVLAAGTGAMTPLAMALAREASAGTGLRVRVEPSIGSGGGIAAARDGAVDLGLVSRPLRPDEARGLERLDLARDAVVLAAAADVPIDDLPADDLPRLYRGELPGLTVLLRDEAESANAALESIHPGLTEERRRSAAAGRFRVLDHDDAMALALATTPRAIGVFSRRSGLPSARCASTASRPPRMRSPTARGGRCAPWGWSSGPSGGSGSCPSSPSPPPSAGAR